MDEQIVDNFVNQIKSLINDKADNADLATVATTGDYDDLINKPIIPALDVVHIVPNKGTASADTMNKLYIEVGQSKRDVYYTEESNGTYSWHKLDVDILDDLSIEWNDIQNAPRVEDVNNKITTLSSSSTHTQYPSAKAVYDRFNSLENYIVTLINGTGGN